jgi:hypothetical protein
MQYNPDTPIYTSDAQAWRIDELPRLLDKLYANGKPIVFFVHGRGKEPKKSLIGGTFVEGLAVRKIERGYDCSVVMFNWDSAFPNFQIFDRTRALKNTVAGATLLAEMLTGLRDYLATKTDCERPSMLVHSMGSVVIQRVLEASHWPNQSLFKSVVFSQPDADDIGHADWLTLLANVERVYVTLNRDDHVLSRSTDDRPEGCQPLGLGTEAPLALNATYLDLTNMGTLGKKDDDHEVFAKGAMNDQLYVCEFFTQALLVGDVRLVLGENVESKRRGVIYVLKQEHRPTAPCLQKPNLSG